MAVNSSSSVHRTREWCQYLPFAAAPLFHPSRTLVITRDSPLEKKKKVQVQPSVDRRLSSSWSLRFASLFPLSSSFAPSPRLTAPRELSRFTRLDSSRSRAAPDEAHHLPLFAFLHQPQALIPFLRPSFPRSNLAPPPPHRHQPLPSRHSSTRTRLNPASPSNMAATLPSSASIDLVSSGLPIGLHQGFASMSLGSRGGHDSGHSTPSYNHAPPTLPPPHSAENLQYAPQSSSHRRAGVCKVRFSRLEGAPRPRNADSLPPLMSVPSQFFNVSYAELWASTRSGRSSDADLLYSHFNQSLKGFGFVVDARSEELGGQEGEFRDVACAGVHAAGADLASAAFPPFVFLPFSCLPSSQSFVTSVPSRAREGSDRWLRYASKNPTSRTRSGADVATFLVSRVKRSAICVFLRSWVSGC